MNPKEKEALIPQNVSDIKYPLPEYYKDTDVSKNIFWKNNYYENQSRSLDKELSTNPNWVNEDNISESYLKSHGYGHDFNNENSSDFSDYSTELNLNHLQDNNKTDWVNEGNISKGYLEHYGYSDDSKISLLEIPLTELQKKELDYLNLSEPEYATYLKIKELVKELGDTPSGNWAKKVMSYLQAGLSRTEKWRKTLDKSDKIALQKILEGFNDFMMPNSNAINDEKIIRPEDENTNNTISPEDYQEIHQTIPNHIGPSEGTIKKLGSSTNVLDVVKTLGDSNLLSGSLREVAEAASNLSGKIGIKDSSIKQDILDSTLITLVSARDLLRTQLKSNPSRLPGYSNKSDEIKSNFGEVLLGGGSLLDKGKNVLDKILDHGTSDAPLNRPEYDERTGKTIQKVWSNGHGNKVDLAKDYLGNGDGRKTSLSSNSKEGQYKFSGIRTTMEELCLGQGQIGVGSLEDLKALLEQSPYITTSSKVNKGRTLTLDSNHTWELRLFPYLGHLNGDCSWLPNIAEINSINYTEHGVKTDWGEWIPVNSFELQSRKMTQKTLGLYDGEISYPVSMEYTNEFRLTLIDDQFKSWKRYFELCADCSTYLSRMVNYPDHQVRILDEKGNINITRRKKNYIELTSDDLLSYSDTTPIVKGTICPGMYKNLSFRCLIYIMTPQMSTIQRFDLLLVLKDYSIEYTGEADASSPDLTISFSVVGENPDLDRRYKQTDYSFGPSNLKNEEGLISSIHNGLKNQFTGDNSKNNIQNIVSTGINLLR